MNINSVILDSATMEDLKTYFIWANDPEVRSQAYNTEFIKFEDHQKWFEQKLLSKNSLMFIFKAYDKDIGQVRFDILENNTALIDYSVDKSFRSKGFGRQILQMAIKKFREKYSIPLVAHVKSDNISSKKNFEKMKFKIINEATHNNKIFFIYMSC